MGLVRLQRKGWERLDAVPACWELERVPNLVLAHIGLMALQWKWKVAAATAMHHAGLGEWAMWS